MCTVQKSFGRSRKKMVWKKFIFFLPITNRRFDFVRGKVCLLRCWKFIIEMIFSNGNTFAKIW